jgi:CubicO group peptidase (beta-lactamase class C family)
MRNYLLAIALIAVTYHSFGQASKVDAYIDSFTKGNNFNGTILIEQNSKILFHKSFGYANFAFKVPNTTNTRYKVASITKAFTSVLVLKLVEQGKIDLNNTISRYLPDYKGPAGTRVTVKQLLNMTSGLKNMDDNASSMEAVLKNGIPQYQLPFTSDQLLEKFCSDSLISEPGKKFDYNNADYIILGKIIEKVSSKTFEQVLKDEILSPLKMLNSGLLSQEKRVDKLADSYFYRDDLQMLVNDLPVYMENWYAAGAMYSTTEDILRFSSALFSGRLLKKETLKLMFTAGLEEYGLGVWIYQDYDINGKMFTIVKRPGSIMGAQTMLFHILEEGSTIIILSNTGTVSLDALVADIAKRMIK